MEESDTVDFDSFCENQQPSENISAEIEDIKPIEQLNEDELVCKICGYKPRKHCKDKKKALEEHMKKHHPEINLENNNVKKTHIVDTINDIEEIKDIALPIEEQKKKLIEDITVLQHKFPDITYKPSYSYPETSLESLQRIKNTYVRIISDKAGSSTAFNMLVLGCRGFEKITGSLGVADLQGFSEDVRQKDEEIIEVLKECIDLGIIESTQISPEIKLLMILMNIGVSRMETNKIIKKSNRSVVKWLPRFKIRVR